LFKLFEHEILEKTIWIQLLGREFTGKNERQKETRARARDRHMYIYYITLKGSGMKVMMKITSAIAPIHFLRLSSGASQW